MLVKVPIYVLLEASPQKKIQWSHIRWTWTPLFEITILDYLFPEILRQVLLLSFIAVSGHPVWRNRRFCIMYKFLIPSLNCVALMPFMTILHEQHWWRFCMICILYTLFVKTMQTRMYPSGFEPQTSLLGIKSYTSVPRWGFVFYWKDYIFFFSASFVMLQFRKSQKTKERCKCNAFSIYLYMVSLYTKSMLLYNFTFKVIVYFFRNESANMSILQ